MTSVYLRPVIRRVLDAGIEALGSESSIVADSENYAVKFDAINIVFSDAGDIAVHLVHQGAVVQETRLPKKYARAGNTFSVLGVSGTCGLHLDI